MHRIVLSMRFLFVITFALSLLIQGSQESSDRIGFGTTHRKLAIELQGLGRRLHTEKRSDKALQLKLIHRNALGSPIRREHSSIQKEIIEILTFDQMRMKAFWDSLHSARDRMHASSESASDVDPENRKTSDTAPTEIQTRISSGASLPGTIGQYFVEFYVGTPGKRFLFIVDTGSDLVWVPCSLCNSCVGDALGTVFLPTNSSTFKPISCSSQECQLIPPPLGATCSEQFPTACSYEYVYSDSSDTQGIFAFETLTLSSSSGRSVEIQNVAIGCGTNNTGPSFTGVGGVIGLGQGPISFSSQVGKMYGGKFSYCFKSFFHRRSSSKLVFGDELGDTKLKNPVQYTPFLTNPVTNTFYFVGIEAVKIGGKVLAIPPAAWEIDQNGNGGTIIDSGTTLSYFIQPAYKMIVDTFKSIISYPRAPPTAGLDLCYNVSSSENGQFPSFSIVFRGNAVFRPSSQNYFLNPAENVKCLGFLESPFNTVLGNLLQQNVYVEYDRLNNRLGFAKAHCSAAE